MPSACPILAFSVHLEPSATSDDGARRALVGAFLEFTRDRSLDAVVRHGDTLDFMIRGEAMQASHADRVAVERWLERRVDLAGWSVGELRDLQEE